MYKCYFSGCKQAPTLFCGCDNTTLMCSDHSYSHSMLPGKSHIERSISNFKQGPSFTKSQIILYKNHIQQLNTKIVTISNSLITSIQTLVESTTFSLHSIDQILNSLLINFSKGQTSEDSISILQFIASIPTQDTSTIDTLPLLTEIEDFYITNLNLDNTLHYIASNYFCEYRLASQKFICNELPSSCILGQNGQMASLGLNTEVYYGGFRDSKPIGSCMLYNKNSKTWQAFKPGKPRGFGASVYYKEKIYFFGGFCLNNLQDCQILSLSNLWTEGAPLPEASTLCVCAALDGIWISGFNMSQVYLHTPESSQYSPYIPLQSESYKYIFSINSKIFIINNNKIWILSQNNWTCAELIGDLQGFPICQPKVLGKYAYFIVFTNKIQVQQFDLTTFSILPLSN